MAHPAAISPAGTLEARVSVRRIGLADLSIALAKGLNDFKAMPSHVMFLSLIYPVVGLLLGRLAFGFDVLPLLYPLVAGFALIGPFAALGLYELSRRREQGLEASWKHAFGVLRSRSIPAIAALGLLLMLIFAAWLATAQVIYVSIFGAAAPASIQAFLSNVLTTPAGWTLIVAGNAVGFVFALVAFTLSVVSFPLLLDRDVSLYTAIETSVRTVLANPVTMAAWGLIVTAALVIGSVPLLMGLAVVMPVLGHSTWHLYRRVVEADLSPRSYYQPAPKRRRYAADFPSVLFPWSGETRP